VLNKEKGGFGDHTLLENIKENMEHENGENTKTEEEDLIKDL
jgi:hypothetical protein